MKDAFSDSLLSWFSNYGRKLPWRTFPSFYHVWLSEIMLQQTRVEAVKNYYERFLNALPNIESLANCEEDIYLKLWQGLGYYSRARNLHKGAIVLNQNSQLPNTFEELIKIPGIGSYTAKAILSIVYQKHYVAVDGNLLRIFSRLIEYPFDIKDEKAKEACDAYFYPHLTNRPGDFNQALMDLGELVCLPHGEPKCILCPLQKYCSSYQHGTTQNYPISIKKTEKKIISKTVFILEYNNRYLIEKRPPNGLLASLYQLPNIDKTLTIDEARTHLSSLGYKIDKDENYHQSKHVFTHLIWQMQGYHFVLSESPKLSPNQALASTQELIEKYSIPSAFSFFIKPILLEE